MESATRSVIVTHSTVVRVERRSRDIYDRGVGKDATFLKQDMGFWMLLSDSHEAIYVGQEHPGLEPGDAIRITFAKVNP